MNGRNNFMKIQKILFIALLAGYNAHTLAKAQEVPVVAIAVPEQPAIAVECCTTVNPSNDVNTECTSPKIEKLEPESVTVFNAFKSELEALINQENYKLDVLLSKKDARKSLGEHYTREIDSPIYDFFNSDILFWAEKYDRLGILDEVLDTYFKITETTPNTIVVLNGTVDKEKTSFFQFITDSASYGYEPAEILFKKLLERDGDPELIINGSNTFDCIQKRHDQFLCRGYNGNTQRCKNIKEILQRLRNVKEGKKALSDFKKKLEKKLTDRQSHNNILFQLNPLIKNAEKFEKLGILDKALDYFFKKTKKNPNSVIEKWMIHRGRDTTFFGFATFPEYSTDRNTLFQYIAVKAAISGKKKHQILFEKLLQRGGDATIVTEDDHIHSDRKTNAKDDINNECDYYCNHASDFIKQHIYTPSKGNHSTEYTRDSKKAIAKKRCESSQYISRRIKEEHEKKEKAQKKAD
jgi:tetratricopeptide (TPR) repeat protein